MALYNLGLGEELRGEEQSALKNFEKAVKCFPSDENTLILNDLNFQLGKLYCRTGHHQRAIDVLLLWYHEHSQQANSGRAFSYLGKACFGLNDVKQAIDWLQKALSFDTFDAEAMGLLGAAYQHAGEGDDIALRLCQKSVELEPTNKSMRYHLALVQMENKMFDDAKSNLRKCVNDTNNSVRACFLFGNIYEKEKKYHNARIWYEKVLASKKVPKDLKKHIRKFKEVHG